MNSHDLAWPCGKVHILPVGRCTCPHSPALAASSSTDALCISEVLAVSQAAASVIERRGVSMTGTNSFLSHARGHQPQTGTTSRIALHFTAAVEMRPRAPSPDRLRHGRLRPPTTRTHDGLAPRL